LIEPNTGVIIASLIIIALGIFSAITATGILRLKNWARLSGLFLSILAIVNYAGSINSNIIILVQSVILIAINLWIALYLIKNKEKFK
jgi:divalent metal cation (Fe/Co/Zn/Cd) transporter